MHISRTTLIIGLVLAVLVGLVIFAGSGRYVGTTDVMPVQSQQDATAEQQAQAQLMADLTTITPQFVEYKQGADGKQILSPELEKIKNDVGAILIGPGPYDSSTGSDVLLNAVGKRYVEITITRPTGAGSSPQILDSATLKSQNISGLFQFVVGKTAVYVSATDICTYTLDQPSCIPLPGAKLFGNEVYGDAEMVAGYFEPLDLSHTNTSMTIAVLEWVPNPEQSSPTNTVPSKILKKVRNVTLALTSSS